MDSRVKKLLRITQKLMKKYDVKIRDTYKGLYGDNLDDYLVNNRRYFRKRHLKIKYENISYTSMEGRIYYVPYYRSAAYDECTIIIPNRLKQKNNPIVHELVHFLQHNTMEQSKKYIKYKGNNFDEYVMQRIEKEAAYIQIKYIYTYELDSLEISSENKALFTSQATDKKHDKYTDDAISLIKLSKQLGII